MGKYVAEWEKIKKEFETTAGMKRPTETVKKAIIGTVQKSSGLTPALKDVDSALDKKERLTLEKAMNKYHSIQEPYVAFLRKEMSNYNANDHEDVIIAFTTFMRKMLMLEDEMSKDAKKLQEAKSPGATAIKWLFLEADVKGTVEKAKKDFTAFAPLEKRFLLVKKADPAMKAANDYTKAAARTEVANALKSLKEFQTEARKCATACDAALKDKDAQKADKYIDSVKSYQKAMNDLATSRAAIQIKNLETAG